MARGSCGSVAPECSTSLPQTRTHAYQFLHQLQFGLKTEQTISRQHANRTRYLRIGRSVAGGVLSNSLILFLVVAVSTRGRDRSRGRRLFITIAMLH